MLLLLNTLLHVLTRERDLCFWLWTRSASFYFCCKLDRFKIEAVQHLFPTILKNCQGEEVSKGWRRRRICHAEKFLLFKTQVTHFSISHRNTKSIKRDTIVIIHWLQSIVSPPPPHHKTPPSVSQPTVRLERQKKTKSEQMQTQTRDHRATLLEK